MSLDKTCPKICCEVCGESTKEILHRHHIKHRSEVGSNNSSQNLICVCPNCHNLIHANFIKIVGIFPSTKPPAGRMAVYIKDGICNFPGMENEISTVPQNESMKIPEREQNET